MSWASPTGQGNCRRIGTSILQSPCALLSKGAKEYLRLIYLVTSNLSTIASIPLPLATWHRYHHQLYSAPANGRIQAAHPDDPEKGSTQLKTLPCDPVLRLRFLHKVKKISDCILYGGFALTWYSPLLIESIRTLTISNTRCQEFMVIFCGMSSGVYII